jgi:DNA-binding protein HU-beta
MGAIAIVPRRFPPSAVGPLRRRLTPRDERIASGNNGAIHGSYEIYRRCSLPPYLRFSPIRRELRRSQGAGECSRARQARRGRELLDNLVTLITKHLKKGERIRIAGLGILQVRKRAARMGRNPATGEAIKIKASKKVSFRASKELKAAI